MDSPLFRDFRLSDTSANRDWQLSSDGESHQATLVLAGTIPEGWADEPEGGSWQSPPLPAAASLARESVRIAWEDEANPGPPPGGDADEDAADAFARRFALARFARRVIEGDPHAWIEALVSFWGRVPLPFDVACSVVVEDDLSVRIELDLPPPAALDLGTRMGKGERHATDRASLGALNLAAVTPSASFEHLGGAMRRERGELVPLAYAPPRERTA